jgi:hypothetical protein
MESLGKAAYKVSLEFIKLCLILCFQAKRPVNIVAGVGCGKSTLVAQVTKDINYKLYDLRLSDKDPTDLGGTPCPNIAKGTLQYLIASDLIPYKQYDKNGKLLPPPWEAEGYDGAVLLIDEIDRSTLEVQNVALQLLLDRRVNGHELYDDVVVCCCGNAESDIGTTPLSSAAATRLINLYVDTTSDKALENWQAWAADNGLPPYAIGFAEHRKEVFCGKDVDFIEVAKCTPRTYTWAVQLIELCKQVGTYALKPKVLKALVYGAIGQVAGAELLGYYKLFNECPTVAEIEADPDNCLIPDDLGTLYAVAQSLINSAANDGKEDRDKTRAFAKYAYRWPEEHKAAFYRRAAKKGLTVAGLQEYKNWESDVKAA